MEGRKAAVWGGAYDIVIAYSTSKYSSIAISPIYCILSSTYTRIRRPGTGGSGSGDELDRNDIHPTHLHIHVPLLCMDGRPAFTSPTPISPPGQAPPTVDGSKLLA